MSAELTQFQKKNAVVAAAGFLFMLSFIFLTDPQQLSAVFLLTLPVLVAITSYNLSKFLIRLLSQWDIEQARQVSAIVASGLTLIVLLSSLHQLGIQDFILATALVTGLGWYLRRLKTSQSYISSR